jgi:hypothetical protein
MRFDPTLPAADAVASEEEEVLEDQEAVPGPETIRAALWRAAHSICGAEQRWSALRRDGADDSTLLRHLASEFGSYGGCSSPVWHQHYGGQNPCLIVGWSPRAITLSGPRLLRLARSVLDISPPGDALQGRLF